MQLIEKLENSALFGDIPQVVFTGKKPPKPVIPLKVTFHRSFFLGRIFWEARWFNALARAPRCVLGQDTLLS